ncbi:transposable element Tcb2 transposase [Trichonephila clavipes]|nr:transposable element Tcb2 transposase [Trichonephila clavipes]
MSSRHHIDDFMRGRIIGRIEEGRKITDVAREFDIAHSVVSRLWKSFKTTGMCSRWHGGGRVRSTTPAEDRYIVLSAKRNRCTTALQVANQFLAASRKQISRKTVARRFRGGGLHARRPVVCVPLTRQHRTARLQWCRENHNWTEQDWACVLFSDESRFSLSSDCRRQLIWRESGTAYRPENIQEKDRYPTCSIMVCTGIMINGRTRLHVVANGTMTGQRYIDEVLLPHVRLFRGAVGDKFVFMDDNATCHRSLAVQDCLDREGIQRLVWPARSPDLNPIENVWDALGRQVAGQNYPPTNKNTLIRALTEEWDKLPQQLLDNVVQMSGTMALLFLYFILLSQYLLTSGYAQSRGPPGSRVGAFLPKYRHEVLYENRLIPEDTEVDVFLRKNHPQNIHVDVVWKFGGTAALARCRSYHYSDVQPSSSGLAVKVTDLWKACQEFGSSTAKDPPCRCGRCTLNMSRLKRPPVSGV